MSSLDSIIEYPLDFPIKIMGLNHPEFAAVIAALVQQHASDFDPASLTARASSGGKYLSLTVTINARNREQLDALYHALSGHPMVEIAL